MASVRIYVSLPKEVFNALSEEVESVYSFEVKISSAMGGLQTLSKVMVNQIRAVDKIRLVKKFGHVPEQVMCEVDDVLKLHYGL
ncbi:MAG: type II toxin-antitoxin system PemK/MazF family toxin [Deltaproteobacteria bacterium]|jgi:mRNA interferase MazF